MVICHFYDCAAPPVCPICQRPESTAFLLPPHMGCERVESVFNLTITNGFPVTQNCSVFYRTRFHPFMCQLFTKKEEKVLLWSAQKECLLSAQFQWMKPQNVFIYTYPVWIFLFIYLNIDYLPARNTACAHTHTQTFLTWWPVMMGNAAPCWLIEIKPL